MGVGLNLLVVSLIAIVLPPGGMPVSDEAAPLPELTAEAWALYDVESGVFLGSQNANVERPMASVTKIMTALVVRELVDLTARVRVTASAASVGESEVGLVEGEVWTVEELLTALLVRSGNDAAFALAEFVGGSVSGFAELMNAKAMKLGLEHSSFVNPHGLDAEGHYTTPADLVVMTLEALKDPVLSRIANTEDFNFRPDPAGANRIVESTNKLLGVYPGVVGFKTGYTDRAGLVLVSVLEENGRTLIGVVMKSKAHFDDSRALLDYGVRSLTFADRLHASLVDNGLAGYAEHQSARLAAVRDLSDGSAATTPLSASSVLSRVKVWLRQQLPAVLGGTSS